MTYTPEQLREDYPTIARMAEAALNETVGYQKYALEGEARKLFIAHAAALEELARLRARLEIDFATDGNGKRVPFPTGGPDGIACRDETIRILESALAEAERKCERLKLTLHEIKEEWAGAECGEPATAQEGYAIELCKRMYRIATEFKEES